MGTIGRKNHNPEQAHLWPLSSLHTEYKLRRSIWNGDRRATAHFQDQKGRKTLIFPS